MSKKVDDPFKEVDDPLVYSDDDTKNNNPECQKTVPVSRATSGYFASNSSTIVIHEGPLCPQYVPLTFGW